MVHLTNNIRSLVANWKRNGFNGVWFHTCEMEGCTLQDFLDDGKTAEDFAIWERDYALFIAGGERTAPPIESR